MANIPFLNNAYFAAKLGIGVPTPNESLEVSGSILLSSRLKLGTGDHYLQQTSGDIYSFTTGKNIMYAGSAEVFRVDEAKLATFKGDAYFNSGLITTIDSEGSFYIDVNANNAYGGRNFRVLNNGTTYLNIDADGNVGIGTSSPDSKLNINGNSGDPSATYTTTAANSTISIGDFSASGLRMLFGVNPSTPSTWIQNQYTTNQVTAKLLLNPLGGNVGIGTTSPGEKLEVDGIIKVVHTDDSYANYRGHGVFFNRTENYLAPLANNTSTLNIGYNGAKWGNIEINGAFIKFENGPNEFMRIDSSGRLLINATSTAFSDKFYVNSDAYATGGWRVGTAATYVGKLINDGGKLTLMSDGSRDVQIGNNNNPAMLYVDTSSANVGIGVTSPQSKLQVAGGIQMANDTATASAAKVGTMRYRTGTEYVEDTGIQLLLNNNFDTDTVWSKGTGWAISSGKANATASTDYLSQNPYNPVASAYYQITWTISNYSAGTYRFYMRGNVSADFGTSTYIGNGTFTHVMQAGGGGANGFLFDARSALTASIDDIILTAVSAEDASYADMCMQTGASTYEWVNIVRNTY